MKKIISFTLALIMTLSTAGLFIVNAEDAAIKNISVSVSGNDINFFRADNGEYYFFLPAIAKDKDLVAKVDATGTVKCGEEEFTTGSTFTQPDGTLTCGGKNYKYHILYSSDIGSVYITTETGSLDKVHADKEYKEAGSIIILDKKGKEEYNGGLDYIKGRGNASWRKDKKGYNIKLEDKTNLFKMGKSKKWCIIPNHDDPTLSRNAVMYSAAAEIGLNYTPLFVPVDFYVNNNYMGSYILTTKMEADSKRVDIENLDDFNEEVAEAVIGENYDMDALGQSGSYGTLAAFIEGSKKWVNIPETPDSMEEKDVSGGYLIEMEIAPRYMNELSGFVSDRSQCITLKSPEYASEKQINYISDYYQRFEDAVFSSDGKNSKNESLSDLADMESFAKYYLLSEWCENQDTGLSSTFFYKDAGGKLYAGPMWDFDIAFGNTPYTRYGVGYKDPEKYAVCFNNLYCNTVFKGNQVSPVPTLYNQLCKNADFISSCKTIWDETVAPVVTEWTNTKFTEYTDSIKDSAIMNSIRWNVFGTCDKTEISKAIDDAVKEMKDFMTKRNAFLTGTIGTVQEKEFGFFEKIKFKVCTAISDICEWFIVKLDLVNKDIRFFDET